MSKASGSTCGDVDCVVDGRDSTTWISSYELNKQISKYKSIDNTIVLMCCLLTFAS